MFGCYICDKLSSSNVLTIYDVYGGIEIEFESSLLSPVAKVCS